MSTTIKNNKSYWKNSWDAAGKKILWDMVHYDVQLVGDDLTVTNPNRLKRAINESSMNSILIKLNQIHL